MRLDLKVLKLLGMTREIGIEEARRKLGDLATQVQYTRQPVTLTRNGRAVARITPYEEPAMTRREIEDSALDAGTAWHDYIADAGYTPEQAEAMVTALLAAERRAFESLLPEGSSWHPDVALAYLPYDADTLTTEELREMRRAAAEAVEARYSEIETATLPDL